MLKGTSLGSTVGAGTVHERELNPFANVTPLARGRVVAHEIALLLPFPEFSPAF